MLSLAGEPDFEAVFRRPDHPASQGYLLVWDRKGNEPLMLRRDAL
jgi:hypothetical protein